MGRSLSIADLALALFAADGREEVLAAWCAASDPPADLVALSDPPGARLAAVLRRRNARWVVVASPPVPLGPLRREPVALSLAEGRCDARDDLLWSLGQREQLVLPLSTGDAGVLVLARAGGPFTIDDLVALAEPAELLAGALDALGRRLRPLAPRREDGERLQRVIEGLPEGVVLLDDAGRVRLSNARAATLLAPLGVVPLEGALLAHIASLPVAPLVADAQAHGRTSAELFLPGDGRTLAVRAVREEPRAGAEPAGVLLLIGDVTGERARQSLLARAERLATTGQLASNLAHEINNPLTTVIGFAQLLQRDPDSAERGVWLSIVEEEAQRCHRLVSELMSVARPGVHQRSPVELAGIADRALATMAATLRAQQVVAVLQVDPKTPPVEVAPDAILQVLLNLMTNALHALEGHPGRREIEIEVSPAPGGARLVVADTGPGIAPEHLGRIFDPFFTTKPEGKGTGLGLAVVCGVVAEHGGTLDVDSAPGRGARFILTLPRSADRLLEGVGRPAGVPAPLPVSAPMRPAVGDVPVVGPPPLPRLDGLSVLVVDDEPAVGAVLAAALHEAGAQARAMDDPEAALDWLLERGADVIVSDLRMPRMSGLELYVQLRRRAPHLAGRLLFSTGDPLRAELEGPPPRPVIGKPFHVADVVRLVREVAAAAPPFPPPEARPEPHAGWRPARRPGGPTHH
jgi:signal transduction histidine kinase